MENQLIVSIAASFIALCALGTTIWQGMQNRKHNKLSVKPILNFDIKFTDGNFSLTLKNNGYGPAIISEYKVIFNDESIGKNADEIAIKLYEELEILEYNKKMYFPGKYQAMAPGETYIILEIENIAKDPEEKRRMEKEILWLNIMIKYKSIYEEFFTLSGPECV